MSSSANFPPSSPVNAPSQFQPGFFTKVQTSITGTAANLALWNGVLLLGQIGFETDTNKFKLGNGITLYNSLSYQSTMADASSDGVIYGRLNGAWAKGVIAGTAAALAAANPVLVAGQLGWETDTLSGKIGDGATAYNTLTYFYRGLPVAGEPSLGTLKKFKQDNTTSRLLYNAAPPAGAAWSAAITAWGVGGLLSSGLRAIRCKVNVSAYATGSAKVGLQIGFSDNNTNVPTDSTSHAKVGGQHFAGANDTDIMPTEIDILLNTSGQFYMYTFGATNVTIASSNVMVAAVGYYC